MEDNLKVTATNDERNFTEIFSGETVVNIPLFQREYKWGAKNLKDFWTDVDAILDGTKSSQFLGVVVTVPRPRAMGAPQVFDVVDGQQRLFTCHLAIAAAVKVALDNGHISWAVDVAKSLLVMRRTSNSPTNIKITPSAKDRQQFNILWAEIANHPKLKGTPGWGEESFPTPPSPSGADSGLLLSQYRRIQNLLKASIQKEGFDNFVSRVNVIASKLSLVTISLRDPIAAPIIFERLNSRGEKITTADLVRNEIFARDASDPAKASTMFSNYWEPFQKKYDSRKIGVETLLFPYGLTFDPNVTKADLFSKLRNRWSGLSDTIEVISELDEFSDTLFALEKGEILDTIPAELRTNLLRLFQANSPSSIYPFVFLGVQSVKRRSQDAKDVSGAFSAIESFLVRRAICGIEPTGLHAVFKGMWSEILTNLDFNGRVTAHAIQQLIKRRTTVSWPDDDQLEEALCRDALYKRKICRFVVGQKEIATYGETPMDDFWIEHVLPRKFHSGNWSKDFSPEEHEELKDTIGNLLPLTAEMNQVASQSAYVIKRAEFENSVFSQARDFAKKYEKWTPDTVRSRSSEFAEWAVKRWPHKL